MSMHGTVDAVRRVYRAIVRAAGLCVLLLAPALLQAGEAAVPRPDDGRVTVIVILSDLPAGGQAGRVDLEAYGAKLERRRHPQWIITLPEASLERLAADPGVKFLQRVYTGEPLPPMPVRPATEGPGKQADSTGVSWQSGDYRYDGAGNITQIGTSQQFQYDKAGRLTHASVNGATEAYAYDSFGNLTQTSGTLRAVPTSTAADKATNRLTGVPYDSAGNVRQLDGADLVYDGFNMLRARIASDGTQTTYVYTADDERIGIEGPAGSRWMIRDLGGKVLREWDAAQDIWQWEEDYIYGGGQLVAAEREPAEGGTRHFHLDHLGTPRLITNANGLKVAAHDYFPFGSEITDFRQEMIAGTAPRPEPMKYTGHERDFVGGTATNNQNSIDYMHARYYTPVRGRFLSVDPGAFIVNLPQSWNRYAYVLNSPMNYTDPSGREPCMVSDPTIDGGTPFPSDCITVEAKADRVDYLSDIFFEFLFEEGPGRRLYNGDDFQTKDLARSPGAEQMRQDFVEGGCVSSSLNPRVYPGSYDSMLAYRETLANGAFVQNPVAAQVGGFSYRFDNLGDGRVMYTAANQLSAWSLLYHIPGVPHKPRGGLVPFMGNVDERFRWTEQLPAECP